MIAKKLISLSAAALLALGVMPCSAFAAESEAKTVRVLVQNNTFSKENGAAWEGLLFERDVELKDDSNLLSVVEDALKADGKTYALNSWGGIGTVEGLSDGWLIALNDWFTDQGASYYTVSDGRLNSGDSVSVEFSMNYGPDIGSDWSSNDTSLLSLDVINGTFDKEFDPAVTEYTLTLDSVKDVCVNACAKNRNFQVREYKNEYAPESESHYRSGDVIELVDGDKVMIGCGDAAWPSMNAGTATVYTINVKSNIKGDDLGAAKEAEALINAIGEVTLDKEKAVTNAQTAYLRLTDVQKEIVGNYNMLEAAVKKLAELKKADVDATFEKMFSETAEKLSAAEPSIGSEWKMIGLARAGKLSDKSKDAFSKSLAELVKSADGGKLSARRSTDNSKESVTAAALGFDPTKYAGKDILSPVKDEGFTSIQGISGEIWANIALKGVGSEGVHTKEILAAQLDSGAFSFDGSTEDVDITAMCITALASEGSASEQIKKAVEWLASKQQDDGSYGNCESTAQVIIALSSAKLDFLTNEAFIKNGKTLIDALGAFYLGNGEFSHNVGDTFNDMSTEQAFLALVSYYRLTNNMSAIYDFTNEKLVPYTQEEGTNPPTGAAAGMLVIVLAGAAVIASRKK